MEGQVITGPWRATKLWNDVVRTFHAGMPRKKHRRGINSYEECFTGAEATDWLHKRMLRNPNFGPDVSREQTSMLLQKMLRAEILTRVDQEEENGAEDASFATSGLYRFADFHVEALRTPGKKTPTRDRERRTELGSLDNNSSLFESNQTVSGVSRTESAKRSVRPKAKVKNEMTEEDKENLNRSYFHSLPANSLIAMHDNERVWESAFLFQLRGAVGDDVFARIPPFPIASVIGNMTSTSVKGVVQLSDRDRALDMPHWVLSAMKCLANWPRPMRMMGGQESALPTYPGFAQDVFGVVKEYFLETCRTPLVPYGLYNAFATVLTRSEQASSHTRVGRHCQVPAASLNSDYVSLATSTPTLTSQMPSSSTWNGHTSAFNPFLLTGKEQQYERVARIRQTLDVPVASSSSTSFSFDNSNSTMTSSGMSECQDPQPQHRRHMAPQGTATLHPGMTTTAIMKNFLPVNSCFETAFMHERPVTRIVPQKSNDTIHLNRTINNRSSYRNMTVFDGDCAKVSDLGGMTAVKRQPRWRRGTRERQSVAVMEGQKRGQRRPPSPARSECNHTVRRQSLQPVTKTAMSSSADDLLEADKGVCYNPGGPRERNPVYEQGSFRAAMPRTSDSNIIMSKAVRKEKRKQQLKRDQRAHSVDSSSNVAEEVPRWHQTMRSQGYSQQPVAPQMRYRSDRYRSLVVKTPVWVDARTGLPTEGVRCVRAEPYYNSSAEGSRETLTEEAKEAATRACQLLGLLLPPSNRRKLQLLLKFIRRISANQRLRLDSERSNEALALEVLAPAILRPYDHLNHRAYSDVGRRTTKFFVDCYDAVWTPPDGLRREVEEKVCGI